MPKEYTRVLTSDLEGNLRKGFIPLSLFTARIIASNAIQNTAEGGIPDGNTAPSINRINGATDKAGRLTWAAGSVAEIQFEPVPLPPDLDNSNPVLIKLLLLKGSNADTVAVNVNAFFGVGDTNCGSATPNLAQARALYTVQLAPADVPAPPEVLTVTLIPGAHTNDTISCDGAWIEYTRAA